MNPPMCFSALIPPTTKSGGIRKFLYLAPGGEELIDALDTREEIRQAAMDKAYDSNAIRAKRAAKGIDPVIPPKANRLEIIVYDKAQYKQRHKVERLFNKIKQCRRVATRYEKRKATCLAFVILALIVIILRSGIL